MNCKGTSEKKARVWGKRPRDGENSRDGNELKSFVRFSDLSAKEKLQRRKTERREKKERATSMSYFKSVEHAIGECMKNGGESSVLVGIIDGFFTELVKLLKADPSLHLLRNAKICRVIEAALLHSPLLHCKSLLYVFLGRIPQLIFSPVASYMLETLFATISRSLSNLEDNQEALEAEMLVGGPGTHTESGVPSTATLFHSATEELCECAEDLLVHEVGSRALRSIILVLGGLSIRDDTPLEQPVRFTDILGMLSNSLVSALEEGYSRVNNTVGPAEAWMAAAQDSTCSFVVQSLLRVSEDGTRTDLAVRQRLEGLRSNSKPLLRKLLSDPMGAYIFQAYLKVPTPQAVLNAGDKMPLRFDTTSFSPADDPLRGGAAATKQRARACALDPQKGAEPSQKDSSEKGVLVWSEQELLQQCCWGKAMELVESELKELLREGSERVAQTGYVLQDLVLYSPTAVHLHLMWKRIIYPFLTQFTEIYALGGVLTILLRKCAYSSLLNTLDAAESVTNAGSISSRSNTPATTTTTTSSDLGIILRQDKNKGVRYFAVPSEFQELVAKELCMLFKSRVPKGAAQYLLVERRLGERSYEIARYILHLHHPAPILLRHGIDKLRLEQVLSLCRDHKGSLVLQEYLRSSSNMQLSNKSCTAKEHENKTNSTNNHKDNKPVLDSVVEKSDVGRFFRRIEPHIGDLVGDKYAAFVVEVLYEVASIALKEAIIKRLIPIYQALKSTSAGMTQEEQLLSDKSNNFIARKVLLKCRVEQYIYRYEDWKKNSQLQCRVHRLLQSIILDP